MARMNASTPTRFVNREGRAIYWLICLVLFFGMLNVLQDLVRSILKNSSYYFSESFLFSSFWWLFAPLLWTQYVVSESKHNKRMLWKLALIFVPVIFHLFGYPALVWLLSRIFYYHTFEFQQTLNYTLSEYVYLLLLFYSVPYLLFVWNSKRRSVANSTVPKLTQSIPGNYISSLLVADGTKRRTIHTAEILFISASPPYIAVHLTGKQYLLNESLKSISSKLDPKQFVRVHKSTIVNIEKVDAFVSRNNGDYDLTLENDAQLRASRNFFADFKEQYHLFHRFTTK